MGLFDFLKATKQSLAVGKQAAEVTRLLGNVYSLYPVNHHEVIEFVQANQILVLGGATNFDLTIIYLLYLLKTSDKNNPAGKQRAENWIAATNRAVQHGVKIAPHLLVDLSEAAKEAYGVDAQEVIRRRPNG